MKTSIRKQLGWAFMGVAVGPLILTGILAGWLGFYTQLEQAKISQKEIAKNANIQITQFVHTIRDHLDFLTHTQDLMALDHPRQNDLLSFVVTHKDMVHGLSIDEIALMGRNGSILSCAALYRDLTRSCNMKRMKPKQIADITARGETYFSPVVFDTTTGEPFMTLAVPIIDIAAGRSKGTLAADIRLKEIWEVVNEIEVGQTGSVFVVDEHHRVVAHADPSVVLRSTYFQIPATNGIHPGLSGEKSLVVIDFAVFGRQTFFIVVEQSLKEAMNLTYILLWGIGGITLFSLAMALTIGVGVHHRIVRPVEILSQKALQIGSGDLSQRVDLNREDELGRLGDAFNTMTRRLQAGISELEDFAYVVSHDLKAPLRGIHQLADWILEDHGQSIDPGGKAQLNLLMEKVSRMDSLINGILRYSRVGQFEETQVDMDLNDLVVDVFKLIAVPDRIRMFITDRLPTVKGAKAQLKQVFQNLIDNSVKYMDKDEGRITVACVDDDQYWKFSIADNGPGIDPRYHDKIFQIFQTLPFGNNENNTGIGLSIVKKIVEVNDGRIWVTSKPGKGSTFYFTWPKQENLKEKG